VVDRTDFPTKTLSARASLLRKVSQLAFASVNECGCLFRQSAQGPRDVEPIA